MTLADSLGFAEKRIFFVFSLFEKRERERGTEKKKKRERNFELGVR
jgi:hypothetical protein